MKCSECGEKNEDNSQFCHNCGKELGTEKSINAENSKNSAINKNTLIICITVIICIAVVAAAFVMTSNSDSDDMTVNNNTTSQNETVDDNHSEGKTTKKISETSAEDSSDARLGSRENPKTSVDYNVGQDGEPNPNYGDYYYLDGTLYRDDNEYLGGAGTFTYISGEDPYS